jgi:hypothetical protein
MASVEQSFSRLKFKQYKKFTVSLERFSLLSLLSIENETVNYFNYNDIICDFSQIAPKSTPSLVFQWDPSLIIQMNQQRPHQKFFSEFYVIPVKHIQVYCIPSAFALSVYLYSVFLKAYTVCAFYFVFIYTY